jgi:predicted ATPase
MTLMRRDLPSGTVTFLFTDVEGSTRLLDELDDRYADALSEHRRVLRAAFTAHGGVEVDTQGDAFFYAFPSAKEAVAAATEAQQSLQAGPISVRMGLHTGESKLTEEGYVGLDVHRAARIAAAGHGGQVLLSQATRELVDAEVKDLGPHRLKDLSATERIYQFGAAEFPALKTLYRTNLPIPATPFLGRGRELNEVTEMLRHEDVRLLTLTGAGGSGKTRLALQAAADLNEMFPDGVYWVALASLRDPPLVLAQAAQALGAHGMLAGHISDKRLLCLFDNFEHLAEAARGLADLLERCPNLKLLVTSREPLRLSAERAYEVLPLGDEDALRLFRERALSAEPEKTMRAICRQLDCLPLAIELAAARTKAFSSAEILKRLGQRLPLLTGGPRDAPERQQTLRATIEWSYQLLTAAEQSLFARLAVFSGGCTLQAAENVVEADLDQLQSLVQKSLLQRSAERYEMLETIREYALGKLEASPQAEDVRRRHAELYLMQGEREESTTSVALRSPETLDRLRPERDNFRAAFTWATGAGLHQLAVRLAIVGAWFTIPWLEWRGMLETALEHTAESTSEQRVKVRERAAAMAKETGDLRRADELSNELLVIAQATQDLRAEASALANIADIAAIEGDPGRARELYEREIELLEPLGEGEWITAVRHVLGEIELAANRLDDAERLFDDALAAARRYGYERLVAKILHGRGDLELTRGRLNRAAEAYRESARLARPFGDTKSAIYCLAGLAAVAANEGQIARSGRLWGAAEAIAADEGLPLQTGDRMRYERAIGPLRSRVEFCVAEEDGRQMSLDAAFGEILNGGAGGRQLGSAATNRQGGE